MNQTNKKLKFYTMIFSVVVNKIGAENINGYNDQQDENVIDMSEEIEAEYSSDPNNNSKNLAIVVDVYSTSPNASSLKVLKQAKMSAMKYYNKRYKDNITLSNIRRPKFIQMLSWEPLPLNIHQALIQNTIDN